MRTNKLRTAALSLLLLGCFGCFCLSLAQSTFSTLVGTVADSAQAVVPGATVTVTNLGTSAVRKATTDSAGNYTVPNLDAGDYQITIEAKGFRKTVFQTVTVRARETIRVDAQMEVAGAITETVTITASIGVTTETPTIAVTKTSRELLELPVPFRASGSTSPISTLTTQPGVQIDIPRTVIIWAFLPQRIKGAKAQRNGIKSGALFLCLFVPLR